jgi:hypothetical protein
MKLDSDINTCMCYDGSDASELCLKLSCSLPLRRLNTKIFRKQIPIPLHGDIEGTALLREMTRPSSATETYETAQVKNVHNPLYYIIVESVRFFTALPTFQSSGPASAL